MIKGVIFDLDGVLVSTDELHYEAWKRLAEEIGIFDYNREDNIRQRGISREDSLNILLQKSNIKYTELEKGDLALRKNLYYQESLLSSGEIQLLPGVINTFRLLKEKNIKVAIGSSSKNAPSIIEKAKINQFINGLVCGLDVVHSKPDPEIFIMAANKIGIIEKECLVIEDSAAGIEAAKRAGMKTLGVGFCYYDLMADYSAKNLNSVDNWKKILEQ